MKNAAEKSRFEPAYLAGLASMCASGICHPLDTIKVRLQTQTKTSLGSIAMARYVVNNSGFISLYYGISSQLMRQATYSTIRFSFYEVAKTLLIERRVRNNAENSSYLPFYQKVIIAGTGGFLGSLVGSPNDLVTVRMQNDPQLPVDKRRNYKNVFEALYRIIKTEGFGRLYVGVQMACLRGVLVTIGQLVFYDDFKQRLMRTKYFSDSFLTHFTASMGAGLIATLITMPADVVKTLLMNAKPGELRGIIHCIRSVLKRDKLGLFRGFWPRYARTGPFTILTFIFYENLKKIHRSLND